MKKREILTPDVTPLIDVVFILLIFFIVSSVFKKDELALVLNLPTSSAKEIELKEKEIIIELNNDKLAIYGKETTIESIKNEMEKVEDKNRNIIFKIDKEVKYEKIIEVLEVLQNNQLFNISLITDTKK
ncbi:MAG: biopolymer transporter ExbD [Aliarcobacter sp.]|jgi:biopolymer transport protein ExbD|nr:biopolymer transporter ExbD [Aliarcobacter sp.]